MMVKRELTVSGNIHAFIIVRYNAMQSMFSWAMLCLLCRVLLIRM